MQFRFVVVLIAFCITLSSVNGKPNADGNYPELAEKVVETIFPPLRLIKHINKPTSDKNPTETLIHLLPPIMQPSIIAMINASKCSEKAGCHKGTSLV